MAEQAARHLLWDDILQKCFLKNPKKSTFFFVQLHPLCQGLRLGPVIGFFALQHLNRVQEAEILFSKSDELPRSSVAQKPSPCRAPRILFFSSFPLFSVLSAAAGGRWSFELMRLPWHPWGRLIGCSLATGQQASDRWLAVSGVTWRTHICGILGNVVRWRNTAEDLRRSATTRQQTVWVFFEF